MICGMNATTTAAVQRRLQDLRLDLRQSEGKLVSAKAEVDEASQLAASRAGLIQALAQYAEVAGLDAESLPELAELKAELEAEERNADDARKRWQDLRTRMHHTGIAIKAAEDFLSARGASAAAKGDMNGPADHVTTRGTFGSPTPTEVILRAMAEEPERIWSIEDMLTLISAANLTARMSNPSSTVRTIASRMRADGRLIRLERGRYRLAGGEPANGSVARNPPRRSLGEFPQMPLSAARGHETVPEEA
jgi:hypothetical protein